MPHKLAKGKEKRKKNVFYDVVVVVAAAAADVVVFVLLLLAAVFAICRFAVGLEVGVGDGVEVAVAVAVGFLRWPCNCAVSPEWREERRGRARGGARHLKVQRVCRRTASTVGASRECGTRREWGRGGAAE